MTLRMEKLALTGIECSIPFFQSLERLAFLNSFSFVVIEFDTCPIYDMLIFSYQRSLPAEYLRLNGLKREMEMLRSGNVRERVESRMS